MTNEAVAALTASDGGYDLALSAIQSPVDVLSSGNTAPTLRKR